MALKTKSHNWDLKQSAEHYFSLCKTVSDIKDIMASPDVFEIRHEELINDPQVCLGQLCGFLGVVAPDDYLNDCADVVFNNPSKTRYRANWNKTLIAAVQDNIERFPFLHGYSYEE
jgi:hypothetical protein